MIDWKRAGAMGLAAMLAGCATEPPTPDVVVYPTALELAPTGWDDEEFDWYPISVLNDTFFPLEIRSFEITGEGSALLEWQTPGVSPVDLPIRNSRTVQVRVARPPDNDRIIWASRVYEAVLSFSVGGTGKIDPETLEYDQGAYRTVDFNVPITFEIDCDYDDDGWDAPECAGAIGDCDDQLEAVNPDAEEVCGDGYNNNCNAVVDEGCPD